MIGLAGHVELVGQDGVDGATSTRAVAKAVANGPIVKTSQLALPKEACEAVYATSGYEQSVSNLSQTSLTSDNVFSDDGAIHQLATMSGDAAGGYTAALTIGV